MLSYSRLQKGIGTDMKLKGKWFEKKVDERQEMDLLKVEHFGFWLMYYMLLAAILIQSIFFEDGFHLAAGEWIIFMLISIICVVGWVRKGVWTYQSRKIPGVRSYLLYSTVTAFGVGIPFAVLFAFKGNDISFKGIAMRIIIMVVTLFVISFPTFFIVGTIAKRREKALAEQNFDDDDYEEDN